MVDSLAVSNVHEITQLIRDGVTGIKDIVQNVSPHVFAMCKQKIIVESWVNAIGATIPFVVGLIVMLIGIVGYIKSDDDNWVPVGVVGGLIAIFSFVACCCTVPHLICVLGAPDYYTTKEVISLISGGKL